MLLFAVVGIIVNWVVWQRGFYALPPQGKGVPVFLKLKHVISLFFIYIATSFFIPAFLVILPQFKRLPPLLSMGSIQAVTISCALLLLYLYSKTLHLQSLKRIWKEREKERPSLLSDLIVGAICWFLTFPLITVLGNLIDILMKTLFELKPYEQVAVRFLKMAIGHPFLLTIALILILIIAPVLEEFLFRGILQNYLKKHFGRIGGICLASLIFAFFHFAPSQKAGNVSLMVSLFAFACFLGFLYEKRRSLFAPIGLHMAFNLMSAIRVLWISEGS